MNKAFWIDTAYRCAWTFAEAMLGCMAIGQTITEIHWTYALSVSGVATLICLLKQIAKCAKKHASDDDIEVVENEPEVFSYEEEEEGDTDE